MNPLAKELNDVLETTVAMRLLSGLGKRLYFPKGIVSQSAEAGSRAKRLNATIGMAVENSEPMMLDLVRNMVPQLSRKEMAAYAPTAGIPALRTIWKDLMVQKNPGLAQMETSLPVVVPGLTNGVAQASEMFLDEGDVVIMPDMFWGNYRLVMEIKRGAVIKTFTFFNTTGGIDLQSFDAIIKEHEARGKLVIALNFPNNPSGYTPTKSEAKAMVDIVVASADRGTDILVICDDAYYGLFFEESIETQSLFTLFGAAHERILALKIDGATKEDYVWSFRLGFMTFASKGLGPSHHEALVKKLMGFIRSSVSSSSGLAQNILLKAYQSPDYQKEKLAKRAVLEARYREVRRIIGAYESRGETRLKSLPFNSGYFMTFRCKGIDAETLRLALLEKEIGAISIGSEYLRIAYASVDKDRLSELYQEIFDTAENLVC